MLGCAFFVTLLGALINLNSWGVVLGFGCAWFLKECLKDWFIGGEPMEGQSTAASGIDKDIMYCRIQAGVEVYSPQPFMAGLRYKVIVRGMDAYHHRNQQGASTAKLDAVYLMGGGQYLRHEGMLLDGQFTELLEEDPHNHCYSFLYTGTGRHVSLFLRVPADHESLYTSPISEPPLQVTVRTLSQEEESTIKAREEQQQREEEEKLRRRELELTALAHAEQERQREAAEIERQELRRRALELAVVAHLESNFFDMEFQQNYAAKHTGEILTTMSYRWRADYLNLLSNEQLYALVQAEHPHVLELFEARFTIARIAQRLAVEPPFKPKAPEPKRRLTREDWESRIERYRQRQLDRMRVDADDRIAKMLERFESVRRLRERAEANGLEEDDIEQLEQQLLEDMNQDPDDPSNSYRQL